MRFLASSSAMPSLSLQRVQGIVPSGKNSPFAQLDSIYTYILDQVDDPEATQDILSAQVYSLRARFPGPKPSASQADIDAYMPAPVSVKVILEIMNPRYTDMVFSSCISDLSAIGKFVGGYEDFVFYHASMLEFLLVRSRSNLFHVDLDAFTTKIFPIMWASERVLPGYLACLSVLGCVWTYLTIFPWTPFIVTLGIKQVTHAITHALITVNTSRFDNYNLDDRDIIRFLEEISRLVRGRVHIHCLLTGP